MPTCERCGYKAKDVMEFVYNEDEWLCASCSLEVGALEELEEKRRKEKVEFT
jgi:hypothetical protein